MRSHIRDLFLAPIVRACQTTLMEMLEQRQLLSAGDLISSFGTNGSALYGDPPEVLKVSAREPDGKLVLAGVSQANLDRGEQLVVRRFNSDGSIDTSFGDNGAFTRDFFSNAEERIQAIATQADGKILLLGHSADPRTGLPSQTLLARLNSDGSLDSSFGSGGTFVSSQFTFGLNSVGGAEAAQILVQSDGKIIAAGSTDEFGKFQDNPDLQLVRFTSSGKLDTSFGGGDGIVTSDIGTYEASIGFEIQDNGKIFAMANKIDPSDTNRIFFRRFNSDGSTSGAPVFLDLDGARADRGFDFILRGNGSLIVSSARSFASGDTPSITSYHSDGTLDTTFGDSGHVAVTGATATPITIHQRSDGSILAESLVNDDKIGDFPRFSSFTAGGQPDTAFSGGTSDLRIGVNSASGFMPQFFIQSNNKVLAPLAPSDRDEMIVARLKSTGQLDPIFATNGITQFSHPLNGQLSRVFVNSDGSFFASGTHLGSTETRLYKFKSDGSLDTSFGGGKGFITLAASGTVRIRPDGKLLVYNASGLSLLNSDGTLDSSFGGDGTIPGTLIDVAVNSDNSFFTTDFKQVHKYTSSGDVDNSWNVTDIDAALGFNFNLISLTIQNDGKVLASGSIKGTDILEVDATIVRLNTDGTIDSSFKDPGEDKSGFIREDLQTFENGGPTVVRPDGRIVLLDHAEDGVTGLIGFNSDGSRDKTFGDENSERRYAFSPELTLSESAAGILLQSDGKILLLGNFDDDNSHTGSAVDRVNENGDLDTTFGDQGVARFTFGTAGLLSDRPQSNSMGFTPDGNLIVVGSVRDALPQLALTKIQLSGPAPTFASLSSHGTLSVAGTGGDDTISVEAGSNSIVAKLNGESISFDLASVKRIFILAFGGNDSVTNSSSRPSTLLGGAGNDNLRGGNGADSLDGGSGNELMHGGKGDDILVGGDGADDLFGDSGVDTADYSARIAPLTLSLDNQANDGEKNEGDNIEADIENVIGGGAGDRIIGNPFANYLKGNGGNDTIYGGRGNDTLDGGKGHDHLNGQEDNDTLLAKDGLTDSFDGGSGTDSASRDNSSSVKDSVLSIEKFI